MTCKHKFSMRCLIKAINYILLGVSAILFISLIVVFIHTLFTPEYCISLTKDGVLTMQDFWLDYKGIIGSLGACLTLFIISYNLQKYIDIETVKALGDLRDKLNSDDNIKLHTYLLHPDDKEVILPEIDNRPNDIIEYEKSMARKSAEMVREERIKYSNAVLFNYIGTIELGAIMLKRGVITFNEFYNQFGYRVENLIRNEHIREHIETNKTYYKFLHNIINKMVAKGHIL